MHRMLFMLLIAVLAASQNGGQPTSVNRVTVIDGQVADMRAVIRAGAGRYAENVVIGPNCRVEMGWDADFTKLDQVDAVEIVDD